MHKKPAEHGQKLRCRIVTEAKSPLRASPADRGERENMDEIERAQGELRESAVDSQTPSEEAAAEGAKAGEAAATDAEQSHEDNARFRVMRKRYEQQIEEAYDRGRKEESAERDREIESWGMSDPTKDGKRITSMADMREYRESVRRQQLEERAKAEGRDLEELVEEDENRMFISRQRKEAEKKPEKDDRREWLRNDLQAFSEAHPEISDMPAFLESIEKNEAFRRFAGSRLYREPLSDLYDDFVEITGKAISAARSRDERSTGAGNGGGAEKLTAREQSALDEWNKNYPQMKMTAKEFLSRKGGRE